MQQPHGTATRLPVASVAAALEPRHDGPLHVRLEHALRDLISSGEVRPGAMVPGELELAAELKVSRHTIRHALGVLTTEGLLRRQRGRGTTVVGPGAPRVFERSLSQFYAFAWEVQARGAVQRSFVLERASLPADADLAARLELQPGTLLERLVRLRTADDEPLVLETAYLPHALMRHVDDATLERGAIYDTLEKLHKVHITRAHEVIAPVVIRRQMARLLGIAAGSAGFRVERTTWSTTGPIEWQVSIVRGDRYLYSVDLPRQE
jgi:GntR family transcriptional regulator